MQPKFIKKILLTIIGFVLFFWISFWFDVLNYNDYITNLAKYIVQTNQQWWFKSRRDLLIKYCNFVLDHKLFISNANIKQYYDASQSVFLYYFCTYYDQNLKNKFNINKKFLKIRNIEKLNLICQKRKKWLYRLIWCVPWCERDDYKLLWCDFSMLITKILTPILNDLSNWALALSIGMYNNKENINKLTNSLAFKYFDFPLYDENFKKYPKTFRQAKTYLKKQRKLLSQTQIIDLLKIIKESQKYKWNCDLQKVSNPQNINYNFFDCAFSDQINFDPKTPNLKWIIDIIYNEIMRYQLFVDFYSYTLNKNQNLIPFTQTSDPVSEYKKAVLEAIKVKNDSQLVHKAIKSTFRIITLQESTFWIHVWFQMYYEELVKFRNALAKIFTPLHQLYYKLRNAQVEK